MNASVRVAVAVTCLISLLSLGGCGGGGSSAVVQHASFLAFVTTSVASGTWLVPYSQTIQITGGVAPFKWSVSSGSLPHNLSLSSSTSNTVTISGTPDMPAANLAFNITVTDSSGQTATEAFTISIVSSITVSVSPAGRTIAPGTTQKFVAFVGQDPTNKGLTWSVSQNGPCSPACGAITPATASGEHAVYTAPATVPANNSVTVTATSVADTTVLATATVIVGTPNAVPFITQPLGPASATPGAAGFTLTVNGSGFASGASIEWNNNNNLPTTFVSGSQLTAPVLAGNLAGSNTAVVTVLNPALGTAMSNSVFFPTATSISSVTLQNTSVGGNAAPVSIATGDFDRNGFPDLVVANPASNGLSILLNGNGGFLPAVLTPAGNGPSSVAVGDFNNDNFLDLAVTNQDGNVSVLLGINGTTFQSPASFPVGTNPVSVVTADFNSDGILDLAVANQNCAAGPPCGPGTVSILLGNGDGTFNSKVDYASAAGPNAIAVGDFDGDGKLDLAVAAGNGGSGNVVSILLGNGDGSFQNAVTYTAGANPVGIAAADFNNDGKLDLAVINQGSNNISILLGAGNGTFPAHVEYAAGSAPMGSLALGDFNNDANLDVAVANSGSNSISVLLGNGDGSFQAQLTYPTGQKPSGVAALDFDGDGRLDFATANEGDNSVSLLTQTNTLSLSAQTLTFAAPQVTGTAAQMQETITNIGDAPASFTISTITGTNASDFSVSGCASLNLAAKAQCTLTVTFTPSNVGPRTASFTISDASPGSPLIVSLQGTGVVTGPNVTFSTGNLNFGDQLISIPSAPMQVTVTNYGTLPVNIGTLTASAPFSESDNCANSTVLELGTCTINAIFTPTAKDGANGMLSVNSNAPSSPQTLPLTGAGTFVELNPSHLSFSCVFNPIPFSRGCFCSGPKQVTVTNTNTAALDINSIAVSGTFFSLETNTCGNSLAPAQSCTVSVVWHHLNAPFGLSGGSLSLTDDGGGSPQTVPLLGHKQCNGF